MSDDCPECGLPLQWIVGNHERLHHADRHMRLQAMKQAAVLLRSVGWADLADEAMRRVAEITGGGKAA